MKKIYIFKHYSHPPPPPFLWPWDICLALSLQPPLRKNPGSASVHVTSSNEDFRISSPLSVLQSGSVTTNIKSSGLLARIQDGDEENRE